MAPAQTREARWTKVALAVLLLLALTLVGLVGYSVIQTSNDRAAAADRAERTAAELHVLASRLDDQAAALDRQSAALERQADSLQESASRADRSRTQFRAAAREILDQLGSDIEAFGTETAAVEPAPPPPPPVAPPPRERETEPSEPDVSPSPTEVHPGCKSKGKGPRQCRDN